MTTEPASTMATPAEESTWPRTAFLMSWEDIEGIRKLLADVPFKYAEPIMLALAPVQNPLN